jgi:hypothetical protein
MSERNYMTENEITHNDFELEQSVTQFIDNKFDLIESQVD